MILRAIALLSRQQFSSLRRSHTDRGEFVFDDSGEFRDGLIATQISAIDKKPRSAGHTGFQADLIVRLHLASEFSAGQAGHKKLLVQAELARTCGEAWLLKHRLIGEKQVVIFPELSLLGGT